MSSDSENSIALVEDIKLRRRSSIFRPDAEPSRFNDLTTTLFPSNYAQRLLNENIKWKATYTTTRMDLQELKKKANENVCYSIQLTNLPLFEAYLRKADEFCCQVNNMIELHKTAITFQNIQSQELQKQIEITSQKLCNKLNL